MSASLRLSGHHLTGQKKCKSLTVERRPWAVFDRHGVVMAHMSSHSGEEAMGSV